MTTAVEIESIASDVLAALDTTTPMTRLSSRYDDFGTEAAYAVTAALRRLREARGEAPVGRKIGFTNRNIWAEYNVFEPIWGDMFDSTVQPLEDDRTVSLESLSEPRIEPEIVFKLGEPLTPRMHEGDLLASIEWVAHGFEIVQSIFPGWRFTAAEAIAAGGLHGKLLLGPPLAIRGSKPAELAPALTRFRITLSHEGAAVDRGTAADVLGGPLHALAHLVSVLEKDRFNPPLAAGEIVTTGTLTRAYPVAPGERWHTDFTGIDLSGLDVTFA